MTAERRPSWSLLWTTGLALAHARFQTRFIPFATLIARLPRPTATAQARPDEIAALTRALDAWSRRLPWRSLCFERGLAAFRILGRRGCHATLYYGAAMVDGSLKAHVWVRSGDRDVVGCDNERDFAILSQYSNGPSSSAVQP